MKELISHANYIGTNSLIVSLLEIHHVQKADTRIHLEHYFFSCMGTGQSAPLNQNLVCACQTNGNSSL